MSLPCFYSRAKQDAIPVLILDKGCYLKWLDDSATEIENNYLKGIHFKSIAGAKAFISNADGSLSKIIYCVGCTVKWVLGGLVSALPEGDYELNDPYELLDLESAYIGFALGDYAFTRYKKSVVHKVRLLLPSKYKKVEKYIRAHYLVRDLITTPAEDMGPAELADQAKQLAQTFSASYREIVGDALLKENYPAIHAVGRASHREPRLAEIIWGDNKYPKLTLVGKGVCFDSGGLDIKGAAGMLLMHKDMGGAAHVLGLARLIMDFQLPVRLRVLIPCVENLINEHAFKPSDVITMRDGTTVEVKNTDAEGRLVLADALYEAHCEQPDLIIDFATLTGAMRVALGTDLPALFATDNETANALQDLSEELGDPVWRMPLFKAYRPHIQGDIADLSNAAKVAVGGGITAALFLQHFVRDSEWVHVDLMAWNTQAMPGQPQGGEAMGLRAFLAYLERRYC
jgi:leucyl aminopeptidase